MMCASESEGAVCEVGIAHLNYSLWILGRASGNQSPGVLLRDCPVLAIACPFSSLWLRANYHCMEHFVAPPWSLSLKTQVFWSLLWVLRVDPANKELHSQNLELPTVGSAWIFQNWLWSPLCGGLNENGSNRINTLNG